MGDSTNRDELDRALDRALAVAVAFVRRPATERTLGRVLASAEALARRGWTVPIRCQPFQVVEAAADPDEWMARFYDPMRVGVLELHLRTELLEWQPLVDQIVNAFRRDEHPLVLVGGLAILDSLIQRAQPRREQSVRGDALDISDDDWRTSLKFVLASSLDIAAERLRPAGDAGKHWTVEGRDAPSGWTREDALKVLNALGTASLLLPQRLSTAPVLAPLSATRALPRAVPTRVTLAPVHTQVDEVDDVFRSAADSSEP